MTKTKKITVWEYLNNRDEKSRNKKIRILDQITHKNYGLWQENISAQVKAIKITEKFLFIFI